MSLRKVCALPLCLVVLIGLAGPAAGMSDEEAIKQLQGLNQAFTTIAKRVTPNVVTISTKQVVAPRGRRAPDQFHPFFRFPMPQERERNGLGSGIVMRKDGYILTNNHVVGDADEITVIMSDNREFSAELVGRDSLTDVAVIRIDASDMSPAKVGNSDAVDIGEWVLAVGAPMGLEFRSTITSGIVSAIGRNLNIIGDTFGIEDFIQTDAAINPGNSGGALVNLRGEVIGVNTAIATQTGQFVGYGFAIPINLAKKVMDDIIEHGRVQRGYLGVGLESVTAPQAEAFGLDRPKGVLISRVFPGTPAEKAQLKAGDIVLKVNGEDVNRPNHIQSLIARLHPGDRVDLTVRRKDRTVDLKANLGEAPDAEKMLASTPAHSNNQANELGITVNDITEEIAESYGIDPDTEGVIVVNVERGPASEAGFRRGDVIFSVRQSPLDLPIKSVADFKAAMEKLKKGSAAAFATMRRTRDGSEHFLFLTPRIPR